MTMFCPSCGAANEDFAQFCVNCGADLSEARERKDQAKTARLTETQEASTPYPEKKLYRSRDNKMITGLAAGMAKYFGTDVDLMRILWIIFAIVSGGIVIVIYLVLALAIPEEPPAKT